MRNAGWEKKQSALVHAAPKRQGREEAEVGRAASMDSVAASTDGALTGGLKDTGATTGAWTRF